MRDRHYVTSKDLVPVHLSPLTKLLNHRSDLAFVDILVFDCKTFDDMLLEFTPIWEKLNDKQSQIRAQKTGRKVKQGDYKSNGAGRPRKADARYAL